VRTITKRIYWSDIIECEGQLFENLDALIAVATETPECFYSYWDSDNEIVKVEITDAGLEITYTSVDDYDDEGNEIREETTEKFSYDYSKELAVLVP
jgi:hypothetical protein